METIEQIKERAAVVVPGARLELVANPGVPAQPSLVVDTFHALAVARFLRDDPLLRFDYASNVSGVDWLELKTKEKSSRKLLVDGVEREVEIVAEKVRPGYLEVVYHLFSMPLRHGPLVLRQRTANRSHDTCVASLTPVWRSAEFQEREVYDLYGIVFAGHPDLRRILMWDGFEGSPMRKDYVEPDDFEYEPTPHDQVLEKAQKHYPPEKEAGSL